MFARLFSLGLMLGSLFPLYLGLSLCSSAHAGYPAWSAYSAPYRGVQFRPLSRTEPRPVSIQRRPQMRAGSARPDSRTPGRRGRSSGSGGQRQQAMFASERSGARKAVPITRGQELGLRFRPDERESAYGQSLIPQGGGVNDPVSEELMSQFRPLPRKRRPTYEELQAETAPQPQTQMLPSMPYPMLPQPPSPYPLGYPPW